MDNNFTLLAAIVTALSAILAPVISNIITSIKDYLVKKMTCTMPARLKHCEQFTEYYFRCSRNPHDKAGAMPFYRITTKLIPLCHKRRTRKSLFSLATKVMENGISDETDKLYNKCVRLLAKEF